MNWTTAQAITVNMAGNQLGSMVAALLRSLRYLGTRPNRLVESVPTTLTARSWEMAMMLSRSFCICNSTSVLQCSRAVLVPLVTQGDTKNLDTIPSSGVLQRGDVALCRKSCVMLEFSPGPPDTRRVYRWSVNEIRQRLVGV